MVRCLNNNQEIFHTTILIGCYSKKLTVDCYSLYKINIIVVTLQLNKTMSLDIAITSRSI